ncbi:MAG: hypothetical protein HKN43_09490 [Rhodothermales bacterium]|nr:hypothetical protein [Rhodothermales bacterium]
MKACLVISSVLLLSSCSFLSSDEDLRTLPHVQNFDLVTINQLNQSVPLPGSYNIRGYVASVMKCPEKVLCIIADGISLYEDDSPNPSDEELRENGIYVAFEDPDQFKVGQRYEISVQVDHERIPEAAWPTCTIVGYDLIR